MTVRAYYNEVDAYAAQWLRNLIASGLITAGDVDTRSIVDVQPSDLRGYTRCHFFAGIGVWDYALGLAGWPADRPVWTGSCPCQPFSAAGRRGGTADERHLWPAWHHLIAECGPSEVFGEQVASADGLDWLDLVHADLDGLGYAFGAADLCAAGVGAPHIRQRSWFVAHALRGGALAGRSAPADDQTSITAWGRFRAEPRDSSVYGLLADAAGERRHGSELAGAAGATTTGSAEAEGRGSAGLREPAGCGSARGLGDAGSAGLPACECPELRGAGRREEGRATQQSGGALGQLANADGRYASAEGLQRGGEHGQQPEDGSAVSHRWPGAHHGGWDDADWILCRDDRWRPVEPGTFPLVDGAAFRVGSGSAFEGQSRIGMLKGYGNAINAEAAATFIAACLDVLPDHRRAA
ncbi:DNA cytosine methyltransferase [Methylobacterium fujisawaense]|uniref:DNA cytosine methyltransferase n=1 Tax=Methylobacterium fujisawaense TaxID=107400 RepID=UPI0031F5812B